MYSEMTNVLQLANGYFNSSLYEKLFSELESYSIRNIVFVPQKKTNRVEVSVSDIFANSELVITQCFSEIDRFTYFGKQVKILEQIEKNVDLKSIQIIHGHTVFSAGYAAMKLSEKYGKPYIVAVRNTDVNIFFKRIPHLRKLGEKILYRANRVIFISRAYEKYVMENYISGSIRNELMKKTEVIPNGISEIFLNENQRRRKVDIRNKTIRLIYAGEINQNKNLRCTLEAAELLISKGINVTVTVVGEISDRKCMHLIKNPIVIYYEKCSQEELLQHYYDAQIFVMPSFHETFGLVYAEAMSCGLPVIYTRGQGFDGQYQDGEVGYGVDPRNSRQLAKYIMEIMKNYEQISNRCYFYSKNYSWVKIAGKYSLIYRSEVVNEFENP